MINSCKMKPLLINISCAIALRNFINTGIANEIAKFRKVHIFCPEEMYDNLIDNTNLSSCTVHKIKTGPEPVVYKVFRQLKKKFYMERRECSTEKIWEKYTDRPYYQKLGSLFVKLCYLIWPKGNYFEIIEWIDVLITKGSSLQNKIIDLEISAVLFTHSNTFMEELVYRNIANMNVKKYYMVLSWDHLSSKTVLHKNYDKILSWNKATEKELLTTYKWFNTNQIEILGIPQYDSFNEKQILNYKQWCEIYKLNSNKKTILYSTMPQIRHNQQHIIIEEICDIINNRKELKNYQVLIKCHPWDNFEGYSKIVNEYKFVAIRKTNLDKNAQINNWKPVNNEIQESRDCLYFCSININIFSTVTIEAAIYDKPIVHIGYYPNDIEEGRIPCEEYYNWEHFKAIMDLQASILVKSKSELDKALIKYAKNPDFLHTERKNLVNTYLGEKIGTSKTKFVEFFRNK